MIPFCNYTEFEIFDGFLTIICKLRLVKRHYLSYLLRIWQTSSAESPKWVASLEDPHSHQVTHFGSLDALLQYLLRSTRNHGGNPSLSGNLEEKQAGS